MRFEELLGLFTGLNTDNFFKRRTNIKTSMNLTISKEQIIAGLQAVQNVVSTRTTLPICRMCCSGRKGAIWKSPRPIWT